MFKKIRSTDLSQARSKPAKELSGGCLALFGLPFLASGVFMSWLYFSGYAQWWSARNWVEVPCWIESAELKSGDDTSQATAKYRYPFEGRTYHGERVSFHSGSDNIGNFQQNAYRELSGYKGSPPTGAEVDPQQNSAKPFRCYVNPREPDQAVLYRTLRWQMQAFLAIFALTFPAVGAGLMVGALLGMKTKKLEGDLAAHHPGAPWKWKRDWAGTSIPESASHWSKALFAYTLWSALVIAPLIMTTALSGAFQHERMAWLLLIFVALWLLPAGFSLKRLRHRLTVGTTRFEPKDFPASPGGMLHGEIILEKPPAIHAAAEISLVCEKSITRQTSDGSSTSTEKIWSHQESVPLDAVTRGITGFRLAVSFKLPSDAPETGPCDGPQTKHGWKLHFKVPGTAVHSVFEIPVFRTGKSPAPADNRAIAAISILDDASADLPVLLAARRIKTVFDHSGAPQTIICPPCRNRAMIGFLFFFNLIWTAVAVFLIKQHAPLLFPIVWAVSASIIWLVILWNILHKRTVTFNHTGLEVRNQLGPIIWSRTFEKKQISGFDHLTTSSSGNTSFYRVRLESILGKKTTLADNITESTTAAALVKRLEAWKQSGS